MDDAAIRQLPKVLLHEHLDGGLRPETVIDLADACGYRSLPSDDPDELERWFADAARLGGLERYLVTFQHTVAVLQTAAAIERVAYEAGTDLAAEGVVLAEVRFAPELNTAGGLAIDDVLEAALSGLARARDDHGIDLALIVDGMRNGPDTLVAAEAAVRWIASGVVGYDIAGPEVGHPPGAHREAFAVARAGGLGVTIHAGESAGPASIAEALECGADRIGHGVRITDDIVGDDLGPLATEIRVREIPLELCPRSNVDTGGVEALDDHPIDRLLRLGFAVTVNCDNRLMSATSPTIELAGLRDAFGWGAEEFATVTETAVRASFVDDDRRRAARERIRSVRQGAVDG